MSNIVRHGFAPTNLTEAIEFSKMLSSSSMVPKQYQGKAEDILVACQWGYELGLAPMQALQNIAVINGRPSVYGDAAMALVQASPVCEDIQETMEGDGTPNPVAVCTAKRKGRAPVVARFSVEDAKRANLWGKQGPWTQYPKRMLQMRARGFALRDAFPDVLKGLITQEEARDIPDEALPVTVVSSEPLPVVPTTFDDLEQPDDLKRRSLMLPSGDVDASFDTVDEWIAAMGDMCRKIRASTKFTVEEKIAKVKELRKANKPQQAGMDAETLARLATACHTQGGEE